MKKIIIEHFSVEKISTYIKYSNNNTEVALSLNDWNIKLSEVLYTPLSYFEIILRNACDKELVKEKGQFWFLNNTLMSGENPNKGKYAIDKVNNAYKKLIGQGKKYSIDTSQREVKHSEIISNLELGFWINLFVLNYFNFFWDPYLKYVFRDYDRKTIWRKFDHLRELRNRVFHHENILKFDLQNSYQTILEIINVISPEMNNKLIQVSNFEKIYNEYNNFRKNI